MSKKDLLIFCVAELLLVRSFSDAKRVFKLIKTVIKGGK